jgi:GT2 family glycosyltransferase
MSNYETKSSLLHPDLIKATPVVGSLTESLLKERIYEAKQDPRARGEDMRLKERRVSVVIRTLNETHTLYMLLQDLQEQVHVADTEIIVVDNESSDNTADVAKRAGATVVNIPRGEFTYPKSMNIGVDAASHDTVFLTVGHTLLSNRFLLAGAARHFDEPDTAGIFARPLLGANASRTEKLLQMGALPYLKPAHKVKKGGMGVLDGTNCMISKEVWQTLGGFDEAYEMGGEDGDLAKRMLAEGLDVIEDPVIAVHHAHGLGPVNYARQVRRWMQSAQPHKIEINKIAGSRPDRDYN